MKLLISIQKGLKVAGLLLILAFPVVAIMLAKWVGALFVIFVLISLIYIFIAKLSNQEPFKNIPGWFFVLCTVYPLANIVQDIYFRHWDGESFDAASHFLFAPMILAFIYSIPKDKLKLIYLSISFVSIIGLVYITTHQNLNLERAAINSMGPTRLPHYILIFSILSVPLFTLKLWKKVLGILGLLSAFAIIIFSQTRSAWIGSLLILTSFIYYYFKGDLKKFSITALSAFLLAIAVIVALPSAKERVEFASREINQEVPPSSILPRFMAWKLSWSIIEKHPLLGIGRNHYMEVRDQLIQENKLPKVIAKLPHPHNEVLFSWVETGLLGLIGTVLFYLLPGRYFWQIYRQNNPATQLIAFCGLNVIFYYFFAGLSDIVIITSTLKVSIYILNISLLVALLKHEEINPTSSRLD